MTNFGLQLFIPHYQPIIDLNTGLIIKYESLARFFGVDGRAVGPIDIPHFFDDEVFLREVFLRSLSIGLKHAIEKRSISINIDLRNINQDFFNHLSAIPSDLIALIQFEISEKTIVTHLDEAVKAIPKMREMGFHVALDNFGIKGGDIRCLQKIQFDTVKISSEIIKSGRGNLVWVDEMKRAMEYLSTYGAEFIADGIETKQAIKTVKDFGIKYGQGYYFGHPMSNIEQNQSSRLITSFAI